MKTLSAIASISILTAIYLMATTNKTLLCLCLIVFAFCCIGAMSAIYENKTKSFYKNMKMLNKDTGLISGRDI